MVAIDAPSLCPTQETAAKTDRVEKSRQHRQRLVVHIGHRAWQRRWAGAPIAGARIDEDARPRLPGESCRQNPPTSRHSPARRAAAPASAPRAAAARSFDTRAPARKYRESLPSERDVIRLGSIENERLRRHTLHGFSMEQAQLASRSGALTPRCARRRRSENPHMRLAADGPAASLCCLMTLLQSRKPTNIDWRERSDDGRFGLASIDA